MSHPFSLDLDQLAEIATSLHARILVGLSADHQEIKALPTYLSLEQLPQEGSALVVDLGGTNIRAAVVQIQNGVIQQMLGPTRGALPVVRGEPLPKAQFTQALVEQVRKLRPQAVLPLGYCFSYPAESMLNGDARLIRWTKEVSVPGTQGKEMGALLSESLSEASLPVSEVTVINDTVAALVAGLGGAPVQGAIGLIVGTGTNMACRLSTRSIPKLRPEARSLGCIPVNLESGNFRPPFLNELDDALDAQSDAPGTQRFEKAVSGAYLGTLLHLAHPEAGIDPRGGAEALTGVLVSRNAPTPILDSARQILDRSAGMVAASLAGTALVLGLNSGERLRVVAEGGLFAGAPGYADRVKLLLGQLLPRVGMTGISFDITGRSHANLLGSALAALSRRA